MFLNGDQDIQHCFLKRDAKKLSADWYPNTSKLLRLRGDLIEVDMNGFGPINEYTWTTSLYFYRQFNFKSAASDQPMPSIAAIIQQSDYDNKE